MSFNSTKQIPFATDKLVGISGGSTSDKTLTKAVNELKAYANGTKKTKPSKKMLNVLEQNGIITKKVTGGSVCGCDTKRLVK